ncbi:ANTAR domain-containing protein [Modestobacter versicolor]|uniref:ANTAR domain-containing protein n=1 Tax=Modestobacter versicolor TaxID=429133 RepID=UPI0034DFF996
MSPRVNEILAGLARGCPDGEGLADRLVADCAHAAAVTGVGLSLTTDSGSGAVVVAVSDHRAGVVEELQFTLTEGPCVDAARWGRPALQPDLGSGVRPRWPSFTAGALAAGLHAVFAFPLRVGAIQLGVLDLYRDTAGPLTGAELAEALCFADAATALLLHLQAEVHGGGGLAAVDDRAEVHQATGVVSVHAGVTLVDALTLLRARAYADGTPIGEVASAVLAGELQLSD